MRKLFYEDTHILDFTAQVTGVLPDEQGRGIWLTLDQTAFFPEEGGQAADSGTIDGYSVLDVQIRQEMICHLVDISKAPCDDDREPSGVHAALWLPGQIITGHVDWNRRLDFMQQHSGEHILSGLLHRLYGFTNVGFHLGASEVTMDFDHALSLEQLRPLEQQVNEIIWQNVPVHTYFPSPEALKTLEYRSKLDLQDNVRIVEIQGVDVCACCAPHVSHTGEIGLFKITGVQSHRGGMRINILCGGRALADYTAKQDSASAISALLSAKQDRLVEGVKKLQDDLLILKERGNKLSARLLALQTAALPSPDVQPDPLLFVELDNPVAIRNTVNSLCETYPGYCCAFNGTDETGYQFVIGSASKDCRQLAAAMRTSLGAKGGGTAPMIQGTVNASRLQLEVFFAGLPQI